MSELAETTVFYSRAKSLRLSRPGGETIDFSGGVNWPGEGKGEFVTDDDAVIAWLQAHPGYGIDFATAPFTPAGAAPKIYTRQEKLDLLLDSLVTF